jgi:hypothetical protein
MAGKVIKDEDLKFLTDFTVFSLPALLTERLRGWTAHSYLLLYTKKQNAD